jgi:hypothetical protein
MEQQYTGCFTPLQILLTLLFVGLKLGKIISWSWWWVLSPLWIGVALLLVLIILYIILT